jgi:hypothetical protein
MGFPLFYCASICRALLHARSGEDQRLGDTRFRTRSRTGKRLIAGRERRIRARKLTADAANLMWSSSRGVAPRSVSDVSVRDANKAPAYRSRRIPAGTQTQNPVFNSAYSRTGSMT